MEESGLFDLIKTLSKAEKRYFKRYAGRGANAARKSHAVQLFEALEQPVVFDTVVFHKVNRSKAFYKNLASEKQHLLKVLLQCLNECHRANNARKQIHFHIDSFELLFQKRQYKLCEKQLHRALKLAQEYDHTAYLFGIYELFGKLYQHSGNYAKMEEMLVRIKGEEKELLTRLEHEFKLKIIEFRSFSVSRRIGYPRTMKDKQAYENLIASAKPYSRKDPSLPEKLSLLTIKNYYYDSLPDKEPLMQVRREWIEKVEKNERFCEENAMQYLVGLNNLANSYDELGMEDPLQVILTRINTHQHKNLDERIRTFIYYYNLKLVGDINAGRFTECLTNFPAAEKGLNQYGLWFHPEYKLGFRYLFAYGYFGVGKYKEALKWTNEMIVNYPKETLEEYYNFARIFILLIYFELGHDGPLEYEMRSAKRYFKKREKLYAFEKILIDFMRNALVPEGIKTNREDLKALKSKISKIRKSPYEQQLFALFDWEAWVESKIRGISFEESMTVKNANPLKLR